MANPNNPKIIGVKIPAANIGETVVFRNLTTGENTTALIAGTDRSAIIASNISSTWNEGDKVQCEVHGRIQGAIQGLISKGGFQTTITATTDTASPGVSL